MSQVNNDENLSREFEGPSELSAIDRREFFRYLGLFSSMTLLAHCSRKAEKIIPFTNEEKAFAVHNYEYYASAFPSQGFSQGILVKSFQGRPIKIEGNPDHAYSFGATSAQAQAALYELYHPGRITNPVVRKKKVKADDVRSFLLGFSPENKDGSDLAFIYPAIHSPTLIRLILELQKKYPKSVWVSPSPWKSETFTTYEIHKVQTILSFDEDLFSNRPDYLYLSRKFMQKRRQAIEQNSPAQMNKLLVVSSSPNLAGAKADQRLQIPRAEVWNTVIDLWDELNGRASGNSFIRKNLSDIKRNGLVVIDRTLHPDALLLERAINALLSAPAKTWKVDLPETISIHDLQEKMKAGLIKTTFNMDPEFTVNQDWKKALEKVPHQVTVSLFPNETTKTSETVIPASHWLESWGDLSTPDGVVSIQQPLIDPLYPSLSLTEIFSLLLGHRKPMREELEEFWSTKTDWKTFLKKGVFELGGTLASMPEKNSFLRTSVSRWQLVIKPDPSIGYGEHAENPVLQELPKPFTRLTWGNVFLLSEKEGKDLKVSDGEKIRVSTDKGIIEGPVMLSALVPEKMLVTTYGYGKRNGTKISQDRGFYADSMSDRKITSVEKIRGKKKLARVQESLKMDSGSPVKTDSLPLLPKKAEHIKPASFYPDHPLPVQETGPQWAMTIDLTTCIGCESCVAACQVENNIPFVGEDQVYKRRQLHWLRIDNYLSGDNVYFQPVPCMHCEKAPCEVVCPVNATVHGNGGLNEMIYNRCVGTRYCSNNCPYKVRRFNFKAYSALPKPWNFGFNPEVSVRDRGVMEKCTYCVQRIKFGERNNEKVVTACQSVCPTEAIIFGDLHDKNSLVLKTKSDPRNYDLLEEEGTRPRTSYLKVIRGPS